MPGSAEVTALPSLREPEMSSLDAVLGRVRALARRRVAWLQHIREGVSSGELTPLDFRVVLEDRDTLEAETAWYGDTPAVKPVNQAVADFEKRLEDDATSTFARVADTFFLNQEERDLLQVCLAVELDPSLAHIFAFLQGDPARTHVTDALAARLCGSGRVSLLDPSGSLVRWGLVESVETTACEPAALRLDPHIAHFLRERPAVDPAIVESLSQPLAPEPLQAWPVDGLVQRAHHVISQGGAIRIWLLGPNGSGRRSLAACVASELGGSVLAVDTDEISDANWPEAYLRAQRQALLFGSALLWHGGRTRTRCPASPVAAPLQFVIGDVDASVIPAPHVVDERMVMPRLSLEDRRALWRRFVPACQAWTANDFDHVVERYRTTVGDIKTVGQRGVSSAKEAAETCRSLTRDRLGDLGKLLSCPFTRDDLTLPETTARTIDDFLFEARERTRFWEDDRARRLFPRGTGLAMLMTGPPGTGKTMAAQVIAAELGLDLVRIDVAASISKYIGETAKNLQKIFARAAEMNSVLLFDEADALFSKRTDVRDAHDRYANTDTNYLLQLLEDFPGIALLASNKRQNIDTAFVRRLRYVVELPRPKAAERLRIWSQLVRELLDAKAEQRLHPALEAIAHTVEMSGAEIKLSLLSALFAARQANQSLQLEHLCRGIERERIKEGRSLNATERERIYRHVG